MKQKIMEEVLKEVEKNKLYDIGTAIMEESKSVHGKPIWSFEVNKSKKNACDYLIIPKHTLFDKAISLAIDKTAQKIFAEVEEELGECCAERWKAGKCKDLDSFSVHNKEIQKLRKKWVDGNEKSL